MVRCGRHIEASRMSRVGCYGMTNADWLISPPATQILSGLLRERVRMAKIKETERVRIPSLPAFFFVSRVTRDASACEKHFPPVIYGESGRRPPPRRFAPRGRTSPYSPEMTGGTYMSVPDVRRMFLARHACDRCAPGRADVRLIAVVAGQPVDHTRFFISVRAVFQEVL